MIDREGTRRRYFGERGRREQSPDAPFNPEVSDETRERIARELYSAASSTGTTTYIEEEWRIVLGWGIHVYDAQKFVAKVPLNKFLVMIELCINHITRRGRPEIVHVVQSLLADDFSSFRIVYVEEAEPDPVLQIHNVENEHLHAVIVDHTFELTREADFESAQRDYAEAWRHYSRGEFPAAMTSAHRGVESACKIVVKRVDPNSAPENMQLGPLVGELRRLDILPQQLQHTVGQIEQIFRSAGAMRNTPGAAHGSLGLDTPEASEAALALRLSGSLIVFLVDRWKQMGAPAVP